MRHVSCRQSARIGRFWKSDERNSLRNQQNRSLHSSCGQNAERYSGVEGQPPRWATQPLASHLSPLTSHLSPLSHHFCGHCLPFFEAAKGEGVGLSVGHVAIVRCRSCTPNSASSFSLSFSFLFSASGFGDPVATGGCCFGHFDAGTG